VAAGRRSTSVPVLLHNMLLLLLPAHSHMHVAGVCSRPAGPRWQLAVAALLRLCSYTICCCCCCRPTLICTIQVYAVDLLGHGGSWPSQHFCEHSGQQLHYNVATYTEQLHSFIQEQIGQPVYVAGNSLGKHSALTTSRITCK
jgi:hypothetical protein